MLYEPLCKKTKQTKKLQNIDKTGVWCMYVEISCSVHEKKIIVEKTAFNNIYCNSNLQMQIDGSVIIIIIIIVIIQTLKCAFWMFSP